jgi:ammonia channel protein AmtB
MFFVLGFLPVYVVAKILDAFGILRVSKEMELAGLDKHDYGDAYPYHEASETEFEEIERTYARE